MPYTATMHDEQVIRRHATRDGIRHFAAGVAVFRDGKLLVMRRAADDFLGGHYGMPGGGVDDGETLIEAARRELFEETGLKITAFLEAFDGFDYISDSEDLVRQVNFRVEVAPGDIRLDPAEHDHYLWISEDDIEALVATPEQKKILVRAFESLRPER